MTLCSKCQIDGEDFVNFCGLHRKHELYPQPSNWKENLNYSKIRSLKSKYVVVLAVITSPLKKFMSDGSNKSLSIVQEWKTFYDTKK